MLIEEWTEIANTFCVSSYIEDGDKKRAILLTSVGIKTYHILYSLLQSTKPQIKLLNNV